MAELTARVETVTAGQLEDVEIQDHSHLEEKIAELMGEVEVLKQDAGQKGDAAAAPSGVDPQQKKSELVLMMQEFKPERGAGKRKAAPKRKPSQAVKDLHLELERYFDCLNKYGGDEERSRSA